MLRIYFASMRNISTLVKMAEYGGTFSMADRIWSKSSASASSACECVGHSD